MKCLLTSVVLCLISFLLRGQLQIEYWENGQKRNEGKIVDGVRDSLWTTWNEEGSLTWKGRYDKGIPIGTWTFFLDSALVERSCKWEKGNLIQWTRYLCGTENMLREVITFAQPVEPSLYATFTQLEQYIYDQEFLLMKHDLVTVNVANEPAAYEQLTPLEMRQYYEGTLYFTTLTDIDHFERKVMAYGLQNQRKVLKLYSLRQVKTLEFWKENKIGFTYEKLDSLDHCLVKFTSTPDQPDRGVKTEYYTNEPNKMYAQWFFQGSQLMESRVNMNGPGNYTLRFYSENKKVKSEGSIKNGQKHGWWKYYNENGELVAKEKYKKGELKN